MNLSGLKLAVLSVAMSAAASLFADICYVKDGSTFDNWADPANWINGAVPGENDIVVVSNKCTVTLKSSDAASVAIVSGLQSIRPLHNQCKIVFDVADGEEITVGAAIYNPEGSINGFWGEVQKTGAGTLVLASFDRHRSASALYDYKVGTIKILEGTVKFPQNSPKREWQFGNIHVEAGAKAVLPKFDTSADGSTMFYTVNGTLTGGGTVEDLNPGTRQLRVAKKCEFAGRITGLTQLFIQGQVDFTGVESTMSSEPTVWSLADSTPGVIGVKKFGMKADGASSIGSADSFAVGFRGGGYKYLGAGGETTDKELLVASDANVYPVTMDGGSTGGITFTGKWAMKGDYDRMETLHLKGENPVPCVLANDIADWEKNSNHYAFQIVKFGSGVWRFADSPTRTWSGTLNVREGTVQFDSIAEAGERSALGLATTLTKPYIGVYDENKKEDYAISLGGVNEAGVKSAGTLEYVGSGRVSSSTRPIVLDGLGGTIKGATSGELALSGVSASGTGAMTLNLDAAEGAVNYLENLDEKEAALSLVKTGAGTWVLQGRQIVSGGITVSGGNLLVRQPPAEYEYYRLTVKSVAGGGKYLNAVELALYDETGTQRFYSPKAVEPDPRSQNNWVWCNGDYRSLKPGEVSFGKPGWYWSRWYSPSDYRDLPILFNRIAGVNQASTEIYYGGTGESGVYQAIDPLNPGSWLQIVMRLPAGSGRISAYDIMSSKDEARKHRPATFKFEGSRDGIFWTTLHEVSYGKGVLGTGDASTGNYQWMSDGSDTQWLNDSQNKRPGCGWPLAAPPEVGSCLENIGKVTVAAGARFSGSGSETLDSIHVDAAGGGTIENFKLAAVGTLEISGYEKTADAFDLGLSFVGCDGAANIAGWTLSGANLRGRKVVLRNGRLMVVPDGLTVIVK